MKYIKVALPLPIDELFEYKVPDYLVSKIDIGKRVLVPFGEKNKKIGFIIEILETSFLPETIKIKEIIEIIDETSINNSLLELAKWMANYYFCALGEVLKAMVPDKQKKMIVKFDRQFNISTYHKVPSIVLSLEQTKALNLIYKSIDEEIFKTFLLHGVTDSGKTEIYLRAISYLKKKRKGVIVLVPEISLTPQTIERFNERFKDNVALFHSRLTPKQRFEQWTLLKEGKKNIVIGARSAIFAPLSNLGLIIIDEEHENSYKQEETPKYNTRDVAIMRAKLENAVIILGSATPSIESYYKAKQGEFNLIELKERVGPHLLPPVEIIDMTKFKQTIISPMLHQAIQDRLKKCEQTILFLNRRGFSTYLQCNNCNYVFYCRNCQISLVYHLKEKKLQCHYCNYTKQLPKLCPKCNNSNIYHYGTGTQKIESYLKKIFPTAKISRLDIDISRKKGMCEDILNSVKKGGIDILIGTQIIAKGLDFPNVTLIGVINADTSINLPDFRAGERTFQLLTQVAGRAGRNEKQNLVIIQTYNPDHYAITFAKSHNYIGFYNQEILYRKQLLYPPFQKMVKIDIEGVEKEKTEELALKLAEIFHKNDKVNILGPAVSPLHIIKRKYRWQIFLLHNDFEIIQNLIKEIKPIRTPKLKIKIDTDPIFMM